jgi:hypothetical protein
MPIKIRCQCGKTLNAPDSAAGKAVKCPGCGKALRVPAGGPGGSVARSKPTAAKSAGPKPQAKPAALGTDDIGSLFDEEGFSAKVEAVCPNCRIEMPANAVLCTKCGFHKETGTVLESHKTVGVDIDKSTLALEKAADDLVKDHALQQELLKGGGMPWWALVMVLVIGGGGLGVAVLGVNAANQETEAEGPGVLASVLMLAGATFQFAAAVCLLIVVIRAFRYYFLHVVTNFKEVGKVFVIGLLLGIAGAGCYYWGSNMPDVVAGEEDTGLTNAFDP